ncbi:MAG: histidinol-phosphatase HisJ family protein [Raoultibacter sp.]
MELITTHAHTNFCGHAFSTVEEMVAAASAAGVTTLALTEHYPLSTAFDERDYLAMHADRVDEYCEAVYAARRAHPELEILLGCELDWLGADEDRTLSAHDFDRFDIVLGSVHFVGTWPFDDPAQRGHWEEVGADEIWRRYFQLWCDAVVSPAPFTIMSHPDLVKKFGYRPSFAVGPLYNEAAAAIQETDRMIEVNTSGNYYACKEIFPAPALLREFCRAGIPCTIGTDAHEPAHIARDIEVAYGALYDAGYRCVTVPTRDGDRREIKIP